MRLPRFTGSCMPGVLLLVVCLSIPASQILAQGRRVPTPFPRPPQSQPQPALPMQMKIRVEDDLVTAELRNVPLQTALEELAARSGIVFEVAQLENDPVSVSFLKVSLEEAVERLIGPGNFIMYYGKSESGQSRIQFVRVLTRSGKSTQASLRYLGTGSITKSGEDTIDSPDQAVKALNESKNVDVRQKAIEVLVASKAEDTVPSLTKAIGDEAPEVRAAAIEGLASLGARAALPQIVQSLKDKHPGVRQSAVMAVALLGDPDNLKDLRPLEHDGDASVAAAADIAIKKLSVRHP